MSKHQPGEIWEDGIRYVLMRPDVLMGTAKELGESRIAEFLGALEGSAFRHVQASFDLYQEERRLEGGEFFHSVCVAAGRLGWGRWSVNRVNAASAIVEVEDSPFASGFGNSESPVCAPIAGVLRAAATRAFGSQCEVVESCCAAQGAHACRFDMAIVQS